jgi:hypothetical protein
MITITTTGTLARLRRDAALVPGLRFEAALVPALRATADREARARGQAEVALQRALDAQALAESERGAAVAEAAARMAWLEGADTHPGGLQAVQAGIALHVLRRHVAAIKAAGDPGEIRRIHALDALIGQDPEEDVQAAAPPQAAAPAIESRPAIPGPAGRPASPAITQPPAGPCPPAAPTRRQVVRGHLDRVLAVPVPANHADRRRGPDRDRSGEGRQLDQVRVLQMLFGHDDVAAAYQQWLDAALGEQAKTARPLGSWDEIAIDSAPIGWPQRDVHGFLCVCCCECFWQVITVGDILERLCGRCARRELHMEPGQVWAPRLPPADGHIACPGLLPGEPRQATIEATLTDGSTRRYGLGDASAFLASRWLGLDATGALSGPADLPRMQVTGSTSAEGHRFSFIVTLDFDPAPQGTSRTPYGFRYTAGTLTCNGQTRTFADPVDLLDTIARGQEAFTTAPAPA